MDLGSGVPDLGSGVVDLGSGVVDFGSGVVDLGSGVVDIEVGVGERDEERSWSACCTAYMTERASYMLGEWTDHRVSPSPSVSFSRRDSILQKDSKG